MTDLQWSAMIRGDESYGRNWGYYCLLEACRDIFGRGNNRQYASHSILTGMADGEFYRSMLLKPYEDGFVNDGPRQLESPNFFIVPQGRCAEFLLFSTLGDMIAEQGRNGSRKPMVVISNGFFDTTGANATAAGFSLETFTQPGLTDPFPGELVGKQNPFNGNLNITAMKAFLDQHPRQPQVCMILITITNNWAAAQPVSMANIHACRFAENAWFIHEFEAGYSDKTISEIVQEMFSYVDGFTLSLKKDGLSNMGGILCFMDKGLFAQQYEGIGLRLKERQILFYGNDSYGGMSGRDIMAAVMGLYEVTKEPYLRNRINLVRFFAQKLQDNGVLVLLPPGGHAVYLDMDEFFHGCDRYAGGFPAVCFTLELLKDYGIRAAEAGPFGWEWDKKPPELQAKIPNLVQFAVPRHVLSDQHITTGRFGYINKRLGSATHPPRHQETGEAELRFLIEAQPSDDDETLGNLTQLQAEALAFSKRIANEYGTRVSLDRFNAIRDLFMPRQPEGSFAACYSYAPGKDGAEWKIYLDPSCTPTPGRHSATATNRTALERIGGRGCMLR
ncbi:hypothetical protein K449DRAFT_446296 [Hypoxylon sp. EC38]|nr:hypothetical protein K449DRAFT_446296 [Hypoxylon sp. EC38]